MKVLDGVAYIPLTQRLIAILWISFLMAGVATMVYFAAIDPMELAPCIPDFPELSRSAAYTAGFLLFWLLTASSAMVTMFFLYPSVDRPKPES